MEGLENVVNKESLMLVFIFDQVYFSLENTTI